MNDDSEDIIVENDNQLGAHLSSDERLRLSCPSSISDFHRKSLEKNSKKNWDLFYKRHGNRFFKRRYWTRKQFSELFEERPSERGARYLLEIGCGCGDFALPLLDNEPGKSEGNAFVDVTFAKDLHIFCCDISDKAIEILKSSDIYKRFESSRLKAFTGDILNLASIASNLGPYKMDYISLIFVLSALDPARMESAIENVHQLLDDRGMVIFRDYAIYDAAMVRFSEKSKIQDRFYVRQDGTRAYFFTKVEVMSLFCGTKFQCETIDYVEMKTVNNSANKHMSRVFLQARFRKKPDTTD